MDWKGKLALTLAGGWPGIRQNVLIPLLGKLGSFTVGYLLSKGVPQELATQVLAVVTATGCLLFDLFVDSMNRAMTVRKALDKVGR